MLALVIANNALGWEKQEKFTLEQSPFLYKSKYARNVNEVPQIFIKGCALWMQRKG